MTQGVSTRSLAELALERQGINPGDLLTDERKLQVRKQALTELDTEMSDQLGEPVSELRERREKIERMFRMIKSIEGSAGMIAGEGFYIRKYREGPFEIFRKGSGVVKAARVTGVMTFFSVETFFEGIKR